MRSSREEFLIASGLEEDGIIAGNLYDKYGSRNPLVRLLMQGFARSLEELVELTGARSIHEVGCGEGHWTLRWAGRGIRARGSDFSKQVIELAERNAQAQGAAATFKVASLYNLAASADAAELVVCSEVLEHLEDPPRALQVLESLAAPWLIASVPREPIWSLMNLARGRYWSSLGNTPGHVQRWSSRAFVSFLAGSLDVVAVRKPLPWTIVLCRRRGAAPGARSGG